MFSETPYFKNSIIWLVSEDQIFSSRDLSLADMVMHKTGGYGCDAVVTAAKGVLKDVRISCNSTIVKYIIVRKPFEPITSNRLRIQVKKNCEHIFLLIICC